MSELKDFIKNNKLDHDETFCVERRHSSNIKLALKQSGIKCTCWPWLNGLPAEMDAQYDEPKRQHALFTGPFTKDAINHIAELADNDDDIWDERMAEDETTMEDFKNHIAYVDYLKELEQQS